MDKKELSDMSEMMMELHEGLKMLVKPIWKWLKKHWDQFVHLVWLAIFVIIAMSTGNDFWIAIGVIPAIAYAIIWSLKKKS
jgi:phage-related minor tail protein